MKKSIKLLAALACLTLAFGFAACGGDDSDDKKDNQHTTCVDTNADGKCDECGKTIAQGGEENSDPSFTQQTTLAGAVSALETDGYTVMSAEGDDMADVMETEIPTGCVGLFVAEKGQGGISAMLFDTEANAAAFMTSEMGLMYAQVGAVQSGRWVYVVITLDDEDVNSHAHADVETNEDGYTDHLCDTCGEQISECVEDEYGLITCSICGKSLRDGTEARPYAMDWNEDYTAWLPKTIEAGATVYFAGFETQSTITITGATSAVWNDTTYEPFEGVITIAFEGAEAYSTKTVIVTNNGEADVDVYFAWVVADEEDNNDSTGGAVVGEPMAVTLTSANFYEMTFALGSAVVTGNEYTLTLSDMNNIPSGVSVYAEFLNANDEMIDYGYAVSADELSQTLEIIDGTVTLKVYLSDTKGIEGDVTFTLTLTAATAE